MCGINGFNFSDRPLVAKMNEATRHRGSDDQGVLVSKNWSLSHNRLSIIDLTSAGHQPMLARRNFSEGGASVDGRFVIVFNGEIYNFLDIKKDLEHKGYAFKSKTDTEVILYAYQEWGSACLQRFNGMFAFAVLDTQTQELFIARDRIGIKPLYYYHKNGKFIFSSEIKAILRHEVDAPLDYKALNIYFRLLYIPSPLTMWQHIYKLPPAHYATVSKDGELQVTQYWQVAGEPLLTDRGAIQRDVLDLLRDSVNKRLMADRPVGVFLSGGIDSTIITGLTRELAGRVETFSVGFEQTEEADKYNSDFLVARQTAKHFQTKHHEYVVSAQDILDNLPATIYHMDEPVSNHIQTVNLLLARETTKHVKVVLGGDGGDELFGGYERYYYNHLVDQLRRLPGAATMAGMLGKRSLQEKLRTEPGVARYMSFFAQKEDAITSFLKSHNNAVILPEFLSEKFFKHVDRGDFTRQFMRTDIFSWLPDESLLRSDKMSMAAGLEQRVPFLDHRLVELADRIPVAYKLGRKGLRMGATGKHYHGKVILREAFADYLPDFVLNQPKWGWFSPAAKWLRGPLQPLMRETLSSTYNAGTRELFDFAVLQQMLDDHITKKQYALNTLWSVMTFQLWYREFMQ